MHILVINDDGPPSPVHSPYVRTMVATLQSRGHTVSVCLPHTQRSWIGKAHLIAARVTATYLRPGPFHFLGSAGHDAAAPSHLSEGATSTEPLPAGSAAADHEEEEEEWVLVDGTPATCAQLGLNHLFAARGAVDAVLSGPNFGRNSTALYALSSGTIGGAMEAALCGARAVALSWAYDSRDHVPAALEATARQSARILEHLCANWAPGVDVYNVNVPVREDVEAAKVMVTTCLHNRWDGSSMFRPVAVAAAAAAAPALSEADAALAEKTSREESTPPAENSSQPLPGGRHARFDHCYFEWAPQHHAVRAAVARSQPGNDGRTLLEGHTSITPLKAAFMEADAHPLGELKMPPSLPALSQTSPSFLTHIAYDSPYVQPIILSALHSIFPAASFTLLPTGLPVTSIASCPAPYLQISSYESLHHEILLSSPRTYFANAFVYRKAIIRKHHLPITVAHYTAKNPDDVLASHVPLTLPIEVDYAEFLDDALVEAWELKEAWTRNEGKTPGEREWWILKPAMSDRGKGIRLFSCEEELTAIFEEWEEDEEAEDEEGPEDSTGMDGVPETSSALPSDGILTSHLRHFVMQPYLAPLLLEPCSRRKFHLRSYVLVLGALRVFVYDEMLALFAPVPYTAPGGGGESSLSSLDMAPHLTNTCLQPSVEAEASGSVQLLSGLPLQGSPTSAAQLRSTIFACTASLFRAAAAQPTHFQPLPNAFEVFGVDWLVDENGTPWLLEVNAFPDFAMSGEEGKGVVQGVWAGLLALVGTQMLGLDGVKGGQGGWTEVLHMGLGRN